MLGYKGGSSGGIEAGEEREGEVVLQVVRGSLYRNSGGGVHVEEEEEEGESMQSKGWRTKENKETKKMEEEEEEEEE